MVCRARSNRFRYVKYSPPQRDRASRPECLPGKSLFRHLHGSYTMPITCQQNSQTASSAISWFWHDPAIHSAICLSPISLHLSPTRNQPAPCSFNQTTKPHCLIVAGKVLRSSPMTRSSTRGGENVPLQPHHQQFAVCKWRFSSPCQSRP